METPREQEQEILANLLEAFTHGRQGDEMAERLLQRFGSFGGVFAADLRALERCGLAEAQAALILALRPIARRCAMNRFGASPSLADPGALADYIRALYVGVGNEQFAALCLNAQRRLICSRMLAEGTLRGIRVQPRALIEYVVQSGATDVIFCHNHPGGQIEFSRTDIQSTRVFWSQLNALGISLIDHMLCAGDSVVSMREACRLDETFYFPPDVHSRGPVRLPL